MSSVEQRTLEGVRLEIGCIYRFWRGHVAVSWRNRIGRGSVSVRTWHERVVVVLSGLSRERRGYNRVIIGVL